MLNASSVSDNLQNCIAVYSHLPAEPLHVLSPSERPLELYRACCLVQQRSWFEFPLTQHPLLSPAVSAHHHTKRSLKLKLQTRLKYAVTFCSILHQLGFHPKACTVGVSTVQPLYMLVLSDAQVLCPSMPVIRIPKVKLADIWAL